MNAQDLGNGGCETNATIHHFGSGFVSRVVEVISDIIQLEFDISCPRTSSISACVFVTVVDGKPDPPGKTVGRYRKASSAKAPGSW
jgi:hypothetical protein